VTRKNLHIYRDFAKTHATLTRTALIKTAGPLESNAGRSESRNRGDFHDYHFKNKVVSVAAHARRRRIKEDRG